MVRISITRMAICVIGILLLLLSIWSAITCPCTPLGKIGRCRNELWKIRNVMLVNGAEFMDDKSMSPKNRICKRCKEYNRKERKDFFCIKNVRGVESVVDPWGTEYNIDQVESIDAKIDKNLLECMLFEGLIVWSSGPNGINERGLGDDVFMERLSLLKD